MGGHYSTLEGTASANFFCIVFREPNKIRLIDADRGVIDLVRRAIQRTWLPGFCNDSDNYGAWDFDLIDTPFKLGCRKEEAVMIKLTACVILQDLLSCGWRIVVSSDLCRITDLSSWFFVRNTPLLKSAPILCVSLSSSDKLHLVNCPANLVSVVRDAALNTWSAGIQQDFKEISAGGLEIKFHGNPWNSSDRGAVDARLMLLHIIRGLARYNWVLYVSSSLKDMADALFFVYQADGVPTEMIDSAWVMSLNRTDRLLLLEASKEVQELVERVITTHWERGIQKDEEYFGSREFKLRGTPWWSHGSESVASRHLITLILQELRSHGWHVLETIDISRRFNDKTIFVFTRGQSEPVLHWCLSLSETDIIRFINAPQNLVDEIRGVVSNVYTYGIKTEKINYGVPQLTLNGQPWNAWIGNDHMHGCRLMISVLQTIYHRGWRLICSADVSAKFHKASNSTNSNYNWPLEAHSWWICALPNSSTSKSSSSECYPPKEISIASAPPQSYSDIAGEVYKK